MLSFGAAIRTDDDLVHDYSCRLFSRFRSTVPEPDYELQIRATADGWAVRDGTIDASVDRREWLPGIVTARLLEETGNRVADHDLFHAAALSREGRGLVLCGESGFGKSLSTLALLGRGWKFLSDEVAAITQQDGRLVPFPKAIEVRPQAARILGIERTGVAGPTVRGKTLHDPESLFPGSLGGPCPVVAVVFLASDSSERRVDPSAGTLRVLVHAKIDGLPEIVSRWDGVRAARWDGERDGSPWLRIEHEPGRFRTWDLDRALGAHGALIVAASTDELPPPDFDREPRLEPIEGHAGTAELLKRYRGKKAFEARLARSAGNFGELFLSMLQRLEKATFYRLEVGRLEPMLALLERSVSAGGTR